MFGQTHIIRQYLPHYFLDYQEIQDEERYSQRITSDDLEEGNLFEFFLAIRVPLFDPAKNRHFKLDNLTRTEENEITEALREALVNTLTHADYFNDQTAITIIKHFNKLTFANPGTMLVKIDEAINGQRSVYRNSILHNIFRTIGQCERQGKGVETIFTNWNAELFTTPELTCSYSTTTLELTLQDGATFEAIQTLQQKFENRFNIEKPLYKSILLCCFLNGDKTDHSLLLWIN